MKDSYRKIGLLVLVSIGIVFSWATIIRQPADTQSHFPLKKDYPEVKGSGAINWYVGSPTFQLSEASLRELSPQFNRRISVPEKPWTIKSLPLHIVNRNGKYYWASNGNKPLTLEKKTLLIPPRNHSQGWVRNTDSPIIIDENTGEEEVTFFTFVNPGGEGLIVIWYIPAGTYEMDWHSRCFQGGPYNYIEYRANKDGTLTPYMGYTEPFPYPIPHNCPPNKP
jgi:hypothetical protein